MVFLEGYSKFATPKKKVIEEMESTMDVPFRDHLDRNLVIHQPREPSIIAETLQNDKSSKKHRRKGKKVIHLSASAQLLTSQSTASPLDHPKPVQDEPLTAEQRDLHDLFDLSQVQDFDQNFQDIYRNFLNLIPKIYNPSEPFYIQQYENFTNPVESQDASFPDTDELADCDLQNEKELSKKKAKKLYRMTVAQLKTLVQRPEVVEWEDVTAKDPLLLAIVKGIKNTIPIPAHWSQKRKYLQGKRGIEKPPFELPSYIRETGVTEQRDANVAREEQVSFKARTREKLQAHLGKLNLDYQKLHDAFFKYQRKPANMTKFGDLYYEGKEYEPKIFHKKPGYLSEDLRDALGMTSRLAPPPWLINMQRIGPPPSYPWLKIPGLNAPIPEGASWGYQPGGWGKAPLDEFNRPLYGDVYSTVKVDLAKQLLDTIDRTQWGNIMVEDVEDRSEITEAALREPESPNDTTMQTDDILYIAEQDEE